MARYPPTGFKVAGPALGDRMIFAWNLDPPRNLGQFKSIRNAPLDVLIAVLASFSIVNDDGAIYGVGISPETGEVVHPLVMWIPVISWNDWAAGEWTRYVQDWI